MAHAHSCSCACVCDGIHQNINLESYVRRLYGFETYLFTTDVLAVLGLGLLFRAAACVVMWGMDRGKKA